MIKLFKSERNVLSILEQDCRMPAKQIARKVHLSTEGVIKIINRLEEKKVISRFNTKFNYACIGYQLFPAHLKLTAYNKKSISDIKNILKNHPSCAWYAFCEGEYDLLLSFMVSGAKDKKDMEQALCELAPYTLDRQVSIVQNAFELSKNFDDKPHQRKLFITFDHDTELRTLSKDEQKILKYLRTNSRDSLTEMSSKLGISSNIIAYHIKKLLSDKIISGFKTKINTSTLEYQPCVSLISLDYHTKEDIKKLIGYCQMHNGINYIVTQIGKYDIEITIDARSVAEFYELMSDIREKFPFIKKISTLIIKETS